MKILPQRKRRAKKLSFLNIILFYFLSILSTHCLAQEKPPQAAVVSAHPVATKAGEDILNVGGNAFDAAVAVASTLAVVEPYYSGLGGGGFWLIHQVTEKGVEEVVIDSREQAPLLASKDMFLDEKGHVIKSLSFKGGLSAAIPGLVKSLDYISEQYGNLSLKESLLPAIRAAENGFKADKEFVRFANLRKALLEEYEEGKKIFLLSKDKITENDLIIQKDLSNVLKKIADEGESAFYQGPIAQKLVDGVNKAGGNWSLEDLLAYELKIRQPLKGTYQDMEVTTVGPPSAGGVAILTVLNILENFERDPLSELDHVHLNVESFRRAYCDRAKYLGDPDFTQIPVTHLTSKSYATNKAKDIDMNKATPSSTLKCGVQIEEGDHTTHFAVIDKQGNRVAATLSINHYFGSGVIPAGTGVILNNEMDDFATQVGEPNAFDLIGHAANRIMPKKRPLSSMAPVFIETENGLGIIGTPGGSRIPTMNLLAILSAEKMPNPQYWVGVPRYHHQYMPDHISFEPFTFNEPQQNALKKRGHQLKKSHRSYGNMQAIYWDKVQNIVMAASDPRGVGEAWVSN